MQSLFAGDFDAPGQSVLSQNFESPSCRSRANLFHNHTQLVPCDDFAVRFAANLAARSAVGQCVLHTRSDEDHSGESQPGEQPGGWDCGETP